MAAVFMLQFRDELYGVSEVKLGKLYAAISSYSSSWSRASVIKMLPAQKRVGKFLLINGK